MRVRLLVAAIACTVLTTACDDPGADPVSYTTFDTSGDTTIAHTGEVGTGALRQLVAEVTISDPEDGEAYTFSTITALEVGADGRIYLWDRIEKALRMFDAQGNFVRQIGRTGSGPGEYSDQLNGMAVRADGKLAIWDARNARITLYSADGEFEAQWLLTPGFFTSNALHADTANNLYVYTTIRRDESRLLGQTGYLRMGPTGEILDTLVAPQIGPETPTLRAQGGGARMSYSIPYHPSGVSAVSPHGHFVAGITDPYQVYALPTSGKPTLIRRDIQGPPVDPAERAERREFTVAQLRLTQPDYRWNGPDIPSRKPAYSSLSVDKSGRIWVALSQPSERIPQEELDQRPAPRPGEPSPLTWRAGPAIHDVFAPNGEFLGQVEQPPRSTFRRMRGDHVWAVTLDANDLPSIVRYRIEPPLSFGR